MTSKLDDATTCDPPGTATTVRLGWELAMPMRFLHVAAIVGCASAGLTTVAETPSWYVITGLGHGQKFGMDQVGSNRDTICYPTDACFLETPVPNIPGYRWRYAIDLDPGSGFELGVDRELDNWRFELIRFANENTFDAGNGLQLSATVRYRFRRR